VIVTVLWEDKRGQTKGFGPHDLLVKCLADQLDLDPYEIKQRVNSAPKKGVDILLGALQKDQAGFKGPVFAVIDRDKVHEHLLPRPTNCMAGIKNQILAKAPGDYDVVFMVDNIESLVHAACAAMGRSYPLGKPRPDERDRYFGELAWNRDRDTRKEALRLCPSFARLVDRVALRISVQRIMS
jgi:hypothetical protein